MTRAKNMTEGVTRGVLPRVAAALVLMAVLCPALEAKTETLTLHLVMHVPEKVEVVLPECDEDGLPRLETNSYNDGVSLEMYEWEHDDDYTVLCIEHI